MKKKIIIPIIFAFALVPVSIGLIGCGGDAYVSDKLVSVRLASYGDVSTKLDYFCGDEFDLNQTFVDLTYIDKEEMTEWTLQCYSLSEIPENIHYEVIGFDSSEPAYSQLVSLKFTSEKYAGEVSTSFYVNIYPEYITEISLMEEEKFIKDIYMLGETLPLEEMKIIVSYSNGRQEFVDVTSDMIDGFYTDEIWSTEKMFNIWYEGLNLSYYYRVSPAEGYEVFSDAHIKCFVPGEEMGFAKQVMQQGAIATFSNNETKQYIVIGRLTLRTVTENSIKAEFNTSGSAYNSNVEILNFDQTYVGGHWATVCEFKYQGQSERYQVIYYNRQIVSTNGVQTITQNVTVEICFANFTTEDEIYNNVRNSIY